MNTLPVFQPPVTRMVLGPNGMPGPSGSTGPAGPTGSTGQSVAVSDEGNPLTTAATSMNFVGDGVTATVAGSDVTVTIPAGGSSAIIENSDGAPASLTSTPTILPFSHIQPGFVIPAAGMYILMARVRIDFAAWRSSSRTLLLSLERDNNTPAQLSKTEIVLPDTSAAAMSYTYGTVMLPITPYTTANTDDFIGLYGSVPSPSVSGEMQAMEAELVVFRCDYIVDGIHISPG
jgi:hypothetical protein